MGRELRMVPPNWSHPIVTFGDGRSGFKPMHGQSFRAAAAAWKRAFLEWESGVRPDGIAPEHAELEYWEYADNPPDRESYVPWEPETATWYQVWENVSEGTPVTPPFATRAELIEYLVQYGDDLYQLPFHPHSVRRGPWARDWATEFVNGDPVADGCWR